MILNFDKPKKARSTEKHNDDHRSDTGIPGAFVPNMSKTDMLDWKAKRIGGPDPRIEIRKTVTGEDPTLKYPHCCAQVLLVVRRNGSVVMSSNGRMVFYRQVWLELQEAVAEAVSILNKRE